MRTYRQILEQDLPKEIAEKAIANIELHYKESAELFLNRVNSDKQEAPAILTGAFPWIQTEEGHIFWMNLCIKLTLEKPTENDTGDA